jgi:hypothetical protein
MVAAKKRKVVDENRTWQSRRRKRNFLFVLKELLFASFVMKFILFKKNTILKRHYETKHTSQLSGIQSQLRRNKITQLQNRLAQREVYSDTAVRASYVVSEFMAER